ncbi:SDR family NAD(P)-dependent oxidoreductase [Bacteroidota bacterium]
MNSLKSKKCLITGASSGLGLELVKLLIRAEAEVIMLCRDEKKSKAIIESLIKDYPNAKIQLEIADFNSLDSLRTFIESFKKRYTSLDVLINNAAALKSKITYTKDGFETMFQVNYFAPFILTNSLIDALNKGNNPQIINVALPSQNLRLDFDDLQALKGFNPMNNLLKTKLCLFLYSLELAKRLNNSSIRVLTGVPNNRPFDSSLGREMPFFMKMVMKLICVKTEKVVKNIFNIISKEDIETGFVFQGLKEVSLIPYWQNAEIRDKLWNESERLLEIG